MSAILFRPRFVNSRGAATYGAISLTILNNVVWFTHLPYRRMNASVNRVSIVSGNGLSSVRRQAITWTNAGLLSFGPFGTNFSEIWIEIRNLYSWKRILKWRLRHFVQGCENLDETSMLIVDSDHSYFIYLICKYTHVCFLFVVK